MLASRSLQFRAVLWDLNSYQTYELLPYDVDSTSEPPRSTTAARWSAFPATAINPSDGTSARHAVCGRTGVVRGPRQPRRQHVEYAYRDQRQRGDIVVGFATLQATALMRPSCARSRWTTRKNFCTTAAGHGHLQISGSRSQRHGAGVGAEPTRPDCRHLMPAVRRLQGRFCWRRARCTTLNEGRGNFPHPSRDALDINHTAGRLPAGRSRLAERALGSWLRLGR